MLFHDNIIKRDNSFIIYIDNNEIDNKINILKIIIFYLFFNNLFIIINIKLIFFK